jgi:hypothetical protein
VQFISRFLIAVGSGLYYCVFNPWCLRCGWRFIRSPLGDAIDGNAGRSLKTALLNYFHRYLGITII